MGDGGDTGSAEGKAAPVRGVDSTGDGRGPEARDKAVELECPGCAKWGRFCSPACREIETMRVLAGNRSRRSGE